MLQSLQSNARYFPPPRATKNSFNSSARISKRPEPGLILLKRLWRSTGGNSQHFSTRYRFSIAAWA